jgi:hypothetical protein
MLGKLVKVKPWNLGVPLLYVIATYAILQWSRKLKHGIVPENIGPYIPSGVLRS